MFNRFFLLIVLVFSLFVLPACSKNEQPAGRYVPEVLLASDCGFDKLMCCSTTPTCNYGQQCCIDSNDSNRNYCAEDCSCGDNEEFCCAGNVCQGKAVCLGGICNSCGNEKQVCCQTGQVCLSGLECQNDKCAVCGVAGGPCCSTGEKCSAPGGQRAECLKDVCVGCGFDGNPACSTGEKCLLGQIFTGKTCERCGASNQPCCNEDSGIPYACDPSKGLKCELGFCAASD